MTYIISECVLRMCEFVCARICVKYVYMRVHIYIHTYVWLYVHICIYVANIDVRARARVCMHLANCKNNPHNVCFICICPCLFIRVYAVIYISNWSRIFNNIEKYILMMSYGWVSFSSSPLCSVGKIGSGEPFRKRQWLCGLIG